VQRPGEYQFRPGMTMKMALSLAGGVYRPVESPSSRFERDIIVSRTALDGIRAKRLELIARQARIEAELIGLDSIQVKPEASTAEFQAALAQETSVLKARRKNLLNQQAGYRHQIELAKEEIRFLKARMDSAIREQSTVENELRQYKTLSDKGLALTPRLSLLERLSAQIEGDQRDIDTRIARAQQNIAQAEAAITKAADDNNEKIVTELRQISMQLNELTQQSAMHRDLMLEAEVLGTASQQLRTRQLHINLSFEVARRESDRVTEVKADGHDGVEPGDVITVRQNFELSAVQR